MTGLHKRYLLLIALAFAILGMIGCGGSSNQFNSHNIGSDQELPGMVGTLSDVENPPPIDGSGQPADGGTGQPTVNPDLLEPIEGQLGSAPLGTNPKYNVEEAESVIQTYKVSEASSLGRSASQDGDNCVEWVSVVAHGADPIPGGAGGPFEEGTKVALYIRYNVYAGQLTLNRTWFIYACGLNFTDTYTHPSEGTYEAFLPFIIPYGSAPLDAVFKGIVSLQKAVSVQIVSDYVGYGEVPFEILYVPIFPPEYYPQENPGDTGGPHPCMPDWGSISVYSDLHVESTDKGVGAVVYVFDDTPEELNGDEVAVKFSGLSGSTFDPTKEKGQGNPFPPINPKTGEPFDISQCTIVFVSSGCNASGWGPNYGWRFDAPFGVGGPDTNQIPTAQIVVEETIPDPDLEITPDYDYNDFVGQYRAVEMYKDPPGVSNNNGLLVQIELTVYAQACSVEEPNLWQLNVDCDMPLGTEVQAIVQLFNSQSDLPYKSGQVLYYSDSGFSLPVFDALSKSLLYPPGYDSVNCDPWNCKQLVNGDWAEITITLLEPAGTGGYDPWPYVPVMKIGTPDTGVKSIGFWKEMDDELNADGKPQAILVPDTYAWPLEGKNISSVYVGFDGWIQYLNDPTKYPPLYNWYDGNPYTGEVATDNTTWKAFSEDKFLQ